MRATRPNHLSPLTSVTVSMQRTLKFMQLNIAIFFLCLLYCHQWAQIFSSFWSSNPNFIFLVNYENRNCVMPIERKSEVMPLVLTRHIYCCQLKYTRRFGTRLCIHRHEKPKTYDTRILCSVDCASRNNRVKKNRLDAQLIISNFCCSTVHFDNIKVFLTNKCKFINHIKC
jgi:hypothetical protein